LKAAAAREEKIRIYGSRYSIERMERLFYDCLVKAVVRSGDDIWAPFSHC